ncbi:MAG TPA: RsmE family RNA methyltransferase [Actinomycetota bacterium]|nr:RsmE family RNA methyltransferase [Actinomycetota bacterium]
MSEPHFFAGAPERGGTVSVTGEDGRHAVRSLRLAPGDALTSSDAHGALVMCRVVEVGRDRLDAVVEERTVEAAPVPRVSVLLAAPKGERLSWAVQKLTEIGVDGITILEAERSVRRWSGERAARLPERLDAVARAAAKQSGRRFLPEVAGPVPWDVAMEGALGEGTVILLWEGAHAGLLRLVPDPPPPVLSLFVGPEGGIPQERAEAARDGGALLASLGSTLLRTETAALVGASIALAAVGRLGG